MLSLAEQRTVQGKCRADANEFYNQILLEYERLGLLYNFSVLSKIVNTVANLKQELPEWCQKDFVHFQDTFTYSPEDKVLEWNDHLFIPQFHQKTVSYAFDHHGPRGNDVMVASCAKTGTTWTREIIRQILYGRDEKLDKLTKDITLPHLYLETCTPSKFNVMHNIPIPRRYFVTHLPAELVNLEIYKKRNVKIVYTLRNPKDRLVSYFHFLKGFLWQDELAKFSPEDPLPLGIRKGESYLDHILSWLPHIKNNKNAILIVYEEESLRKNKRVVRIPESKTIG
uniref:amine sulfotransferase-like n=1 Tax=Styela clava TaxID=7725 RepID=UPI001939D8A3|nr:amine sulfotransferase-like [Styela clava]